MRSHKFCQILLVLLIVGIFVPSFSFIQGQETQGIGEKISGIFEKIWKEEVLPVWQKMWNWFKKTFWDPYLGPFFKTEIEKRKPIIKEEFQKEKEEVKTEAPQLGKSLWNKFKELIK